MIYFTINVSISEVWLKERKTYAEENNVKLELFTLSPNSQWLYNLAELQETH